MRYRLMASYRGSPFEAGIGPTDGDIVLFAACPPPEELGFEPATGHWRKQMHISDVQAVWESRPIGRFRGERCMVLDDLGDRLHIGFLGHDGYKAEQLGYWQVDRGVFELVVPKPDVSEVLEDRIEYRPSAAASHQPRPEPAAQQPSQPSQPSLPYPGPAEPARLAPSDTAPASTATAGAASAGAASAGTQPAGTQPAGTQPAGTQPAGAEPASAQTRYEPMPRVADTGSWLSPLAMAGSWRRTQRSVLDDTTGVALPVTAEAPLPLEAQALRAASESRRARRPVAMQQVAVHQGTAHQGTAPPGSTPAAPVTPPAAPGSTPAAPGSTPAAPGTTRPGTPPQPERPAASAPPTAHAAAGDDEPEPSRPRRTARRRMATEQLFADLASQAGIPADSYAVGEEIEGAMCLVETAHGFEVFHAADGARHELQVFASEEAACFYLFGVLAAEAVRTGTLVRGSVTSPA